MKTLFEQFPTLLGLAGTHEVLGLAGVTATDKSNYVSKYYPLAEIAGKKYNLNPVVILAQAGIESAFGTSYMARNINNFFGITAAGKPNDYWKGEIYISKSSGLKFRKYPSAQDCFYDFARLISSNYKAAASVSFSVADYAREISESPYAEQDPKSKAIYRKAIISNAAYILKARGSAEASSALTNEANKVTVPSQTPGTDQTARQSNVTSGDTGGAGGLLLFSAAAALLVFTFSNSKH